MAKKQYALIDILKCVMAVFVLIIHRPIFPDSMTGAKYYSENVICSMAVPFFFMVSAFFFFRKLDGTKNDRRILFNFEKRIFILYAVWSLIYLPCTFVKDFKGHYSEITPAALAGEAFFVLKRFIFDCTFVHLWYLNTLMLGVFIVYVLTRKLRSKSAFFVCLAVFLAVRALMCFEGIGQAFENIPPVLFKTLSQSLLCAGFGMLAAKNGLSLPAKKGTAQFAASFVLMLVSGMLFRRFEFAALDGLRYLFAVLCAFSLLLISLGTEIKSRPVYGKMRNISILVYLSQLLLMSEGYAFLARETGISALENLRPLQFCITLILSVSFSLSVLWLKDRKGFGWLKYLY